jgi:hypothetical protein
MKLIERLMDKFLLCPILPLELTEQVVRNKIILACSMKVDSNPSSFRSASLPEYAKNCPSFRISLLYLDLDLDKPTYDTLVNLWLCRAPL